MQTNADLFTTVQIAGQAFISSFFKTVLFCMQMLEPLKREFWVDQSELNLIEPLNQSVRTQKCQPGELQDFMLGKIF